MICLDANAVIVALSQNDTQVRRHLSRAFAAGVPVHVSSVVVFELRYGIAKSKLRRKNEALFAAFLAGGVGVLAFDGDDALEAGELRAFLARAGTPIGPYDVLIAAQAKRRGATLITANTREFARVPGLTLEDGSG